MILSDRDIIRELQSGGIVCSPLDEANISSSSIDLRLGQYIVKQSKFTGAVKFKTDNSGKITVVNPPKTKTVDLLDLDIRNSDKFVIKPGEFILAQTLEIVGHPNGNIVSQVLDKSSLARLGLSICFSAGFIDPGNVLRVTLEIKNNSSFPIELQYGMHICQVKFSYLSSSVLRLYDGKYKYSLNLEIAK